MFLDSVQLVSTVSGQRLGSYKLTYNTTALPAKASKAQDYWGYFNNKTSNTDLIPMQQFSYAPIMGGNVVQVTVGGADRSSNETAMQAWILKQMTFPTGGYSQFTYEANRYLESGQSTIVGGLRIKSIISDDSKGKKVTKTYKYGITENGIGTKRDLAAKFVSATTKIKNPPTSQSYFQRIYSSDIASALFPMEGQVVTYPWVTVYEDNGVGNHGKTVYQFKDDAHDEHIFSSATGRQSIVSYAWARGKLLNKTVYGAGNAKKLEEINTYQTLGSATVNTVGYLVGRTVQTLAPPVVIAGCLDNDDAYDQIGYNMYTGLLKLSSSEVKTYNDLNATQSVSATTTFQYNGDYQLKEKRFVNSDGTQRATVYRFCNDIMGVSSSGTGFAQAIYRLKQNNQLSKPVEILHLFKDVGGSDRILTGKLLLDTTFSFSGRTYVLPNQTRLLEIDPDGSAVNYSGFGANVSGSTLQFDNRYAQRLVYDTYDAFGNLTKYRQPAGAPTGLAFSTVALNSVYHTKITQETANKGGSPGLEYLTTFAIDKPILGIKQITAPNGLNTSFEYDHFGRFLRSKDHDGKILVEHGYQLAPDNFIKKFLPRIALTSVAGQSHTKVETISGRFDGLGRPLQTIHESGGPGGSTSIVEGAVSYDDYDRIAKSYRTYSQTGTGYELPASVSGDSRPFSQVEGYDNSPLHRPKKTFGPGETWKGNDKFVENKYLVAAAGEVRKYALKSGTEGGVNAPSTYGSNTLLKNVQITEQGNETRTYVDNQGRTIQGSQQVSGSSYRSYYNIYDRYDRKRYVLQPVYFDLPPNEFDEGDAVFTRSIFGYRYDARGRLIREHIPGAGWTEYVFDRLDRVVLSQTAQQKLDDGGKWSYVKYDPLGRVIETGVLESGSSRATLQTSFNQITQAYETWAGTDYTTVSFPSGLTLAKRTQNIYDTYPGTVTSFTFDGTHAYGQTAYSSAKGLLTISLSWDSRTPSTKYIKVFYYNTKNRIIQTIEGHHLGGATLADKPIKTSFQYNFAGDLTAQRSNYKFATLADVNHTESYTVDHKGRPTGFSAGTAGGTPSLLQVCTSIYDEVGRLKNKKYRPGGNFKTPGGPIDFIVRPPQTTLNITEDKAREAIILEPGTTINVSPSPLKTYSAEIDPNAIGLTNIVDLQSIDYRYNIRDWLEGINSNSTGQPTPNALERDLFSLSLEYETAGFFDGNIGKQSWSVVTNPATNATKTRSYSYTYDASSRLKNAIYTGETNENYDEKSIVYDKNGNITALQRYGKKGSALNQLIDNLTYTYNGNRLTQVEDAVSGGTDVDFVNRTSTANEYTYFADGSLKTDGNEDIIQDIVYDSYLKKPVEIKMTGSRWIKYTYNGHGALLRRELSTGEVWDYVGNMILKNNQYYQINMPEGRVVYQNSAWHQEYEYRDQVGNLRVAFRERNDSLVMIQATDYSPFGIQFNSQLYSGAKQNYEYQGHETQLDHGLRRIMMGARCFNPTIGRMDGVDNFASAAPAWSSYRFAFNNPNMYTDPDGNFEQSQYTSSSTVEVHGGTFNNGFREVSFRAAGYSVDYYNFSEPAQGEESQSKNESQSTGKGSTNEQKVPVENQTSSSLPTDLPDGRMLWDLSSEELALFDTPEGRRALFGGDYDIQLTIAERLYLVGHAFTMALPSAKVATLYKAEDFVRYSNKTLVSNQLIKGKGATGAQRIPAFKGGGTNPVTGKSLPYHFHIHKYNWYKPSTWFTQTPIIKP